MRVRVFTFLVLAACGVLSFRQSGYWKNDLTLYPHTLDVNPNSFVALNNMGDIDMDVRDYSRAQTAYAHSVQLASNPIDQSMTHNNLCYAYLYAGRLDDALREKRRALDIDSNYPALHQYWARHTAELGAILFESGRFADAVPYLKTAHAIAPLDQKVTWMLHRATTQATVNK
jgi:tetratricopeptide (TPR) repeat protein